MYDSLSSQVAREMFGSDEETEELATIHAEETGRFKMKTPPWLLPAALGAAGGAGLTALGFSLFRRGKKKKAAAAAFAGVDPRQIDARKNDMRDTAAEFGFGGGLGTLGDRVANEMFGGMLQRTDFFGHDDLDDEFGALDSESLLAEEAYGALTSPSLTAEEEYGWAVPTWALLQGRERRVYVNTNSLRSMPMERIQRLLTRRGTTARFRSLLKNEIARRAAPRF